MGGRVRSSWPLVAGLLIIAVLMPAARWVVAVSLVVFAVAEFIRSRADPKGDSERGADRKRHSSEPPDGMRNVLDALGEPAFLIDAGLSVLFRNAASQLAFGVVTVGDPIVMWFRAPEVLVALEAAVASAQAQTTEFQERPPRNRFWEIDIRPIPADIDGPAQFLVFFRDRTNQRRLERMRSDFVANASHELRTPLTSMTGFIETLQGPAREDAAARERFLAIMLTQARRMSRLIDDLLSLSRIEMKPPLGPDDTVDLRVVLRTVCQSLMPMAAEANLDLRMGEGSELAAWVHGDSDELVQVFANLVENACKYGASGGAVVVGLRHEDVSQPRWVEAFVQDFGPGIAPQHVPRLTERFYRVPGSDPSIRGTGLGLSIVRNVLLRHGTRLQIASKLEEGSTFSIRFQLK